MQNQWFFRHPKCTPSACRSLRWDLNLPSTATVASNIHPPVRHRSIAASVGSTSKSQTYLGDRLKRAAKTLLEGGSPLFAKQDLDSRPSIMSYYEESWCEENVWGWKKSFRRSDTSTVADAPATTCPLQLQSLASWHQDRNHTSDGSISRRPQAVSAWKHLDALLEAFGMLVFFNERKKSIQAHRESWATKLEVMLLYLSDVSTEIKMTFDILPDTLQESELWTCFQMSRVQWHQKHETSGHSTVLVFPALTAGTSRQICKFPTWRSTVLRAKMLQQWIPFPLLRRCVVVSLPTSHISYLLNRSLAEILSFQHKLNATKVPMVPFQPQNSKRSIVPKLIPKASPQAARHPCSFSKVFWLRHNESMVCLYLHSTCNCWICWSTSTCSWQLQDPEGKETNLYVSGLNWQATTSLPLKVSALFLHSCSVCSVQSSSSGVAHRRRLSAERNAKNTPMQQDISRCRKLHAQIDTDRLFLQSSTNKLYVFLPESHVGPVQWSHTSSLPMLVHQRSTNAMLRQGAKLTKVAELEKYFSPQKPNLHWIFLPFGTQFTGSPYNSILLQLLLLSAQVPDQHLEPCAVHLDLPQCSK